MFFLHENLSLHGYIRFILIINIYRDRSIHQNNTQHVVPRPIVLLHALRVGYGYASSIVMYPIAYTQLDVVFQWSTVSVEGGGSEKTFRAPDSA